MKVYDLWHLTSAHTSTQANTSHLHFQWDKYTLKYICFNRPALLVETAILEVEDKINDTSLLTFCLFWLFLLKWYPILVTKFLNIVHRSQIFKRNSYRVDIDTHKDTSKTGKIIFFRPFDSLSKSNFELFKIGFLDNANANILYQRNDGTFLLCLANFPLFSSLNLTNWISNKRKEKRKRINKLPKREKTFLEL